VRNIPLILLAIVIAVMIVGLLQIKSSSTAPVNVVAKIVPRTEPVNQKAYTGRMVMPSIDDIYVLENSAGRDILQIEKFLQGRAAGLHWLAAEHFKAVKKAAKKSKRNKVSEAENDVIMGLKLTLDSLGQFSSEILFCNVDDKNLKDLVREHIQAFWRYPRSNNGGKFEMWAPFVWKLEY